VYELVVLLPQLGAGRCAERIQLTRRVNEHSGKMSGHKTLHLTLFVLSCIIHRTLTNEGINMNVGDDQRTSFLTLIGGEDIFSENLTRKIEELIAPTLQNSTQPLCRNHSEFYISGLRNGTAWAYKSK
jgi:hypothetical protein